MNAGVFKFDRNSDDNTITLNFRYPQGTDAQTIKAELEKLNGVTKVTLSDHEHTPHYVPADDPLVATLLSVYEKQTGLKGYEQVIGGGTFGRFLNVVLLSVQCSQIMSIQCTKQMNLPMLKTFTVLQQSTPKHFTN